MKVRLGEWAAPPLEQNLAPPRWDTPADNPAVDLSTMKALEVPKAPPKKFNDVFDEIVSLFAQKGQKISRDDAMRWLNQYNPADEDRSLYPRR